MSKTDNEKKKDMAGKPRYVSPAAMRLDDIHAGAGACGSGSGYSGGSCGKGSIAGGACGNNGSIAAGACGPGGTPG